MEISRNIPSHSLIGMYYEVAQTFLGSLPDSLFKKNGTLGLPISPGSLILCNYLRSPFLEFSLLACDWWLASIPTSLLKIFSRLCKLNRFFRKLFGIFELAEIIQDTVAWTENLKSPRIIKTHLPLSMLPPSLLETSKVLYVGR